MHQPRPIALPAALLLATASLACTVAAACAFLLVALVVIAGHGAIALDDGAWAVWCGAAACACATVAVLIALTRACGGLRPMALGGAWALAFAWPLSSAPAAAAAATLATAFVVRWGTAGARRRAFGVPATATLAALALALLTVAFDGVPAGDAAPAGEPQVGDTRREEARTGTDATGAAAGTGTEATGTAARTGGAGAAPRTGTEATGRAGRTGRAVRDGAQRGTDAPRGGVAGAPPQRLVRAYYRALDRRDFAGAWALLSPAVRMTFGGFDHWRAGFAATLSSRPTALRADGDTVDLLLVARDRAACGVLVQTFAVRWRLRGGRAASVVAQRAGAPRCAPT